MASDIDSYDLWRLVIPLGRVIGDNNCRYDRMGMAVVHLTTADGHNGWGYATSVWEGEFAVPAWYIQPMASLAKMRDVFDQHWWPAMRGRSPFETRNARLHLGTECDYLDRAVRVALWDLMAQQVALPLFRLLGGDAQRPRVRAYGSLLDYPMTEDDAVAMAKRFIERGFTAIKVKVGAPDVQRDIQRLTAIRNAVGEDVELTADANTIWTCDVAIERLRAYENAGIRLGYIEDPLPPDDVEGFARLRGEANIDVIAHDYIDNPRDLRALLEAGGLDRIRGGDDIDHVLASAELAEEHDVPIVFGNSLFEISVHAAAALDRTDRLECSDLAWNDLVCEPVRFEDGYAIAPQVPGHGLVPKAEALDQYADLG